MNKHFTDAAEANGGEFRNEVHAMHDAIKGAKTPEARLAAVKAAGAVMLANVQSFAQLASGIKAIAANIDGFGAAVEHGFEG